MTETAKENFREALGKAGFSPSSIQMFFALATRDSIVPNVAYAEKLLVNGIEARNRSLDYSEKMAELKQDNAKRERDERLFAESIVANPQVLADLPTLLKHAANYHIEVSKVVELWGKVSTKVAQQKTA